MKRGVRTVVTWYESVPTLGGMCIRIGGVLAGTKVWQGKGPNPSWTDCGGNERIGGIPGRLGQRGQTCTRLMQTGGCGQDKTTGRWGGLHPVRD